MEEDAEHETPTLTAAQAARAQRQRERAMALRAAKVQAPALVQPPPPKARDTGGGFLLEEEPTPVLQPPPSAPLPCAVRPRCEECGAAFAASFLLDNFACAVCDECRNEPAYELLPRTEAKRRFLLMDADLDARGGALPCVSRRNPRATHGAPMRLYVTRQLQQRAHLVWGGEEGLQQERERRSERAAELAQAKAKRELKALRLATRGPRAAQAPHVHQWGEEQYDSAEDSYSRTCTTCGHQETYEKM